MIVFLVALVTCVVTTRWLACSVGSGVGSKKRKSRGIAGKKPSLSHPTKVLPTSSARPLGRPPPRPLTLAHSPTHTHHTMASSLYRLLSAGRGSMDAPRDGTASAPTTPRFSSSLPASPSLNDFSMGAAAEFEESCVPSPASALSPRASLDSQGGRRFSFDSARPSTDGAQHAADVRSLLWRNSLPAGTPGEWKESVWGGEVGGGRSAASALCALDPPPAKTPPLPLPPRADPPPPALHRLPRSMRGGLSTRWGRNAGRGPERVGRRRRCWPGFFPVVIVSTTAARTTPRPPLQPGFPPPATTPMSGG